jgi:hypothetical protein
MKYKLLQKYPNLPVDWEVGMEVEECPNNFKYIPSNKAYSYRALLVYDVENYPEYWEKVVEKDYEILNVVIPEGLGVVCNGTYNKIPAEEYKINSIKRLSDGEIFTVGDKFQDGTITYMRKSPDLMWIFHNGKRINVKLEDAFKIKQPLFTTEDGVEIFEGDNIWEVFSSFQISITIWKSNYGNNGKPLKNKLYFSTKEKAEEYILMNKPCLSVKDVMNAGYGICNPQTLLKIVKEKHGS